jgi:Mrp family chromosome partitioning ATPase
MASRRPAGGPRRGPSTAVPLRVMPGSAPSGVPADHPANWDGPRSRTLVVASGKGGVGKSNLCANLAVEIGRASCRERVLTSV